MAGGERSAGMNGIPRLGGIELLPPERLPGAGIDWLRRSREASLEAALEQGLPTTRQEAWRYTDLRLLRHREFHPLPGTDELPPWHAGLRLEQCHELVFLDGVFLPEQSRLPELPEGALVGGLADLLELHAGRLRPLLDAAMPRIDEVFPALARAQFRDGAVVLLPPGCVLERPLQLLFLSSGRPQAASTARIVFSLGEGARATVLETHASSGEVPVFCNLLTGIELAEGAVLEHLRLQYESEAAFHFASIGVRQAAGSRLASHNLCLGARLARTDIAVELGGERASVDLWGLTLGGGRSHIDNHTRVDHVAPRTTSEENYKAVLGDRSRGVFNGKVVVHPGAQQIVAGQSSPNLLLSTGAEMDTKPELEIYADDVQCRHGATVGQLDDLALFYLRSRGVPESEARAMLIHAFAGEVIQAIGEETLREHCLQLVDRRLDQLLGLEPETTS